MPSLTLPQEIFKAYDIRGIVGKTLTPAIVTAIGRAIGTALPSVTVLTDPLDLESYRRDETAF